MTNTEYNERINKGFKAFCGDFGIYAEERDILRSAAEYLMVNNKYQKSILEDEDPELYAYREALEIIFLNYLPQDEF